MTGRRHTRYRRLLCFYPRAYRRERGEELLATLLEAGRSGPTVREAADLLRHGLRARLGRPASRTVVVWAVLAAVISGVFAAAFATRAAWETARPLPDAGQTRAMLAEIVPDRQFDGIGTPASMFEIYGSPLSWASRDDLLFGDGGEYAQTSVGGTTGNLPAGPARETLDAAVGRLRSAGWTVYPPMYADTYSCVGPPCDPLTIPQSTTIVAARGDTVVTLELYPESDAGPWRLSLAFQRATPWAVYPAAIGAGTVAAVVAFLLFGWASRRTAGGGLRHAPVPLLLGVTLFFWCVPTLFAVPLMALHHAQEPHPSWHPMWEWLGQPTFSLFFVIGAGSALLALGLAAIPAARLRERSVAD